MKTTSRLAVLAAAGLFATQAQAADLGGNCCTDLEERIAELEATTVRKGNRNVSLTLYGHVNEMIMAWDDGFEKNVYVGTNDDARSRFGFKGNAKINSEWSAGFIMEFGLRIARSDKWNQCSDNDAREVLAGAPADACSETGDDLDPQFDVRKSAWYLQSTRLGRITVGRESTVDSVNVNLANVNAPIYDDMNDDFRPRISGTGFFGNAKYDQLIPGWSYNPPSRTRQNIIRYDSPTFQGFTFSANWGEDDYWAVALRYANEFNGVRVAAAASYSWLNEGYGAEGGCTAEVVGTAEKVDCEAWGIGGSMMHVASGLFLTGAYGVQIDNLRPATDVDDQDSWWMLMGGIERKWNSLGKTTLYVTYYTGENNDRTIVQGGRGLDMWSVGVNQQIEAAAMDLYLAYYNFQADLGNDISATQGPTEDMHAIVTGAKIRF